MFRDFNCLKRERNGNFSIITALLLPVLLGVVGVAVDFTLAVNEALRLQAATDAAALAVARQPDLSDKETVALARAMLVGNGSELDAQFSVNRVGTSAQVVGEAKVKTTFSAVLGFDYLPVSRVSVANVSEDKFEIAMVLDTTGSMEGGKLTAMKQAATDLVDDLSAKITKPANLKFALVPFSSFVNVGPDFGPAFSNGKVSRQPAQWLDALGKSPIAQKDLGSNFSRFILFYHLNAAWAGCVESRPTSGGRDLSTTDDTPSSKKPETLYVPAFSNDEPGGSAYMNNYVSDSPATINQATWDDRRKRYGVTYTNMPTTLDGWAKSQPNWAKVTQDNSISYFYSNYNYPKGPNFMCKTQKITPLTNNYKQLKSDIGTLYTAGSTNINEGAAWGWRVLSNAEPFSEGAPESDKTVKKIMILLTDGTNSFGHTTSALGSAYSSYGYLVDGRTGTTSTDQNVTTATMNSKTLSTCDNAKAAGIQIYTILLEEANGTTSDLLTKCASSPEMFVNVPDRAGLAKAFEKIKNGISGTRITN